VSGITPEMSVSQRVDLIEDALARALAKPGYFEVQSWQNDRVLLPVCELAPNQQLPTLNLYVVARELERLLS
jgi:hypothetical protein